MDEKIKNVIENHIENNDVCLFMKGTPDAPQCGFQWQYLISLKF